MTSRVPVTFLPSGSTAWVAPGQTVLNAGRAAGVNISAPCGGRGVCGACGVKVVEGSLESPTSDETRALKHAPRDVRLACRAVIAGPVTLRPIVLNSTVTRESGLLDGEQPVVVGVDLGTTSVSAAVLDAKSGRQLGTTTVMNRQASFGADVLSRISSALEGDALVLQDLAEQSVIDAVDSAAPGARSAGRISRVVIATNVAMASLLAGADVSALAAHPFSIPRGCDSLDAGSKLRSLLPSAVIHLVPPIGGFVGGDVLSGLVALGMGDSTGRQLLIDVGTNAEVALSKDGRLWVASAAAGPAFEGGGISCGGPATPEAVISVDIQGSAAVLHTLGEATPMWFSGAGLVSAVAALRRSGHLAEDGRLTVPGPLEDRFSTDERGVLGVGFGEDAECLSVTQLDIRALQLAKAAVSVAISEVLSRSGTVASELERVHVSGAFGGALSPEDLVDLGVVPLQVAGAVRHAGNTSLQGAALMAMEPSVLDTAVRLAQEVDIIDLAANAGFGAKLMEALALKTLS